MGRNRGDAHRARLGKRCGDAGIDSGRYEKEVLFATTTAREAGGILLDFFKSSRVKSREKGFLDVVTEADMATESYIAGAIRSTFPDDGVVGEEGTSENVCEVDPSGRGCDDPVRTWYIDPLDGTFNFARGLPFWCTSVGLTVGGRPTLGVVFDPLHDDLFTAVLGGGAFLNRTPIQSKSVRRLLDAAVQVNVSFDRQVLPHSLADTVAIGKEVMRMRNMGALALELCYVACGRLDGVVQRGSHPWDYAAAVTILRESGGVVSTLDGSAFDIQGEDAIAAATPDLHASLVAAIAHAD